MRSGADVSGRSAFGEGEEVLFLENGLDEADCEGRIAAVDVSDVVRILFIDFVDDETEDFAEVVVICFGVFLGGADGKGVGEDAGGGASLEEADFFEGGEGEEVLVAVGVEDEAFEVVEVFLAEAAGDAGFEAEETEDGGEGNGAGNQFFEGVVLGGRVRAVVEVLLDFEGAAEDVGLGIFHYFFGEVDVDL